MEKINNNTTIRQNPDAAVEIVNAIESQRPSTPEAQKHIAVADALTEEALHLENQGHNASAAEKYFQAQRKYEAVLGVDTDIPWVRRASNESAFLGSDQVAEEVIKAVIENPPAVREITFADMDNLANFSREYNKKPGFMKVVEKVSTLLRQLKDGSGQAEPSAVAKEVKGAKLQIRLPLRMKPERIRGFEEEGPGDNRIDIVTVDNIAIECKNYAVNSISSQSVEGAIKQAVRRLPSKGKSYSKVIIVFPNNVIEKVKKFFNMLIQNDDYKEYAGRIKLSAESDINKTLDEE